MTFITTFLSLVATAFVFNNHSKLVNVTCNRIPSSTIIRSILSPSKHGHDEPLLMTPPDTIFSNLFVACPVFFSVSIFLIGPALPAARHRTADLVLALIIALLTFKVAYRASVVLGTVLLQTSPPRGMASGKMEAFLRAVRELRGTLKSYTSPHRISGISLRAHKPWYQERSENHWS